ncbi:MAG: glycosyltransferase family 2 protein [Desulfomonilaceae bacterium]
MKYSIIVPTFNRSASLKIAILSLLNQEMSRNFYEILIIDNGSTDDTANVARELIQSNGGVRIRYYFEPIPGLLSGRHRGAIESDGEILVFVDDDIVADKIWMSAIDEAFDNSSTHLVGGKSLPDYQERPPEWLDSFWHHEGNLRQCFYLSLLDFGDRLCEINPLYVWGLNFSIRKKTLFELGGFHPDCLPKMFQRYQGDGETGLAFKVKAKGYDIVYQPRALVHHVIPASRLTVEYFKERMFYAGVHDSFTSIRRSRGLKSEIRMLRPLPQLRRFAGRFLAKMSSGRNADLIQEIRGEWLKGYEFHRREVGSDPDLLKWVLKDSYIDYRYGPFSEGAPVF